MCRPQTFSGYFPFPHLIHTHTHTYTHTYTHTHTHAQHTNAHTYTHTHAHTHMQCIHEFKSTNRDIMNCASTLFEVRWPLQLQSQSAEQSRKTWSTLQGDINTFPLILCQNQSPSFPQLSLNSACPPSISSAYTLMRAIFQPHFNNGSRQSYGGMEPSV